MAGAFGLALAAAPRGCSHRSGDGWAGAGPRWPVVGGRWSAVVGSMRSDQALRSLGRRSSVVGVRPTAVGSRQSAVGSRQSAVGSRQSAVGSRQSPPVPSCRSHPRCSVADPHPSLTAESRPGTPPPRHSPRTGTPLAPALPSHRHSPRTGTPPAPLAPLRVDFAQPSTDGASRGEDLHGSLPGLGRLLWRRVRDRPVDLVARLRSGHHRPAHPLHPRAHERGVLGHHLPQVHPHLSGDAPVQQVPRPVLEAPSASTRCTSSPAGSRRARSQRCSSAGYQELAKITAGRQDPRRRDQPRPGSLRRATADRAHQPGALRHLPGHHRRPPRRSSACSAPCGASSGRSRSSAAPSRPRSRSSAPTSPTRSSPPRSASSPRSRPSWPTTTSTGPAQGARHRDGELRRRLPQHRQAAPDLGAGEPPPPGAVRSRETPWQ